jgi:hypothetical protein
VLSNHDAVATVDSDCLIECERRKGQRETLLDQMLETASIIERLKVNEQSHTMPRLRPGTFTSQ